MKKLIGLFLLLIFCVGCEKDTVEEPKPPIVPDEPKQPYDYAEFGGYHVKDTVGFDKNSIVLYTLNDSTWIFARKDQKAWFGLFDLKTKLQLSEWQETSDFLVNEKYSINLPPFKISEGYVFFIQDLISSYKVIPFLLKESKAIHLRTYNNVNWGQESLFEVKDLKNEILIYHPDLLGNLYSKDGEETATFVSISKQDSKNYFLSGFIQDKTWFGVCEDNILKQQFIGEGVFERNIKLHLGYGEYKDYYVEALSFDDFWGRFIEMDWGYIFAPAYGEQHIITDIFLCKEGKMERMKAPDTYFTLYSWYNNSFLIYEPSSSVGTTIKYTIYSSDKDIILTHEKKSEFYVDPFKTEIPPVPISYTDYISNENWSGELRIRRYNLDSRATYPIWQQIIATIPNNSIATWTLLDRQSEIWLYRIDILNYDGSKEQIQFSININTGDLKIQ